MLLPSPSPYSNPWPNPWSRCWSGFVREPRHSQVGPPPLVSDILAWILLRYGFDRPPQEGILRRARTEACYCLLGSLRRVEIALTSLVQLLSGRLLHDGFGRRVIIALLELIQFLGSRMLHDG